MPQPPSQPTIYVIVVIQQVCGDSQSPMLAVCLTGTTADTSGDTTIQAGSLLDDGQWHDVEVSRKGQNLSLIVDRLEMTNVTNGDFYQLDLDRKVAFVIYEK